MRIDTELMADFTHHLTKENVRFLLLIRWPEDGRLVYSVNGYAKAILGDIEEFVRMVQEMSEVKS